MKRFRFMAVLVFLLSLASTSHALSDKVYKELSKFTQVLELVDQHYVDKVDDKDLIEGAIKGMLFSLDPHTVYLSEDMYRDFKSDTKGRFGGIGIEVTIEDGFITVISPLKGTPGERAGIQPGDRILKINDQSTKHMSLGEATHIMRGPVGRKVTLTLWRRGNKRPIQVTVKRKLIKVSAVKSENLGGGYGYFEISSFQEGVGKALKKAIQGYKREHGNLKGMILDLRNNSGGLLTEASKVVDLFIRKGVIVSTKGRTKVETVKKARSSGTLDEMPMVVLINSNSASAAEIVAGALQDHNRAKLVGTKSYGKGSVQTIFNLSGRDALKITIAKYLTPKGRMIDGKGIEPDVKVDQKMFRKRFKQMQKEMKEKRKANRNDYFEYQKGEALKLLKRMR